MSKSSHSINQQGFTLIELLVSVVILSVGIVAILHAMQSSLIALGSARDHLWAGELIREETAGMDIMMMAAPETAPSSSEGTFPEPYDAFSWRTEVVAQDASRDAEKATNRIDRIDISVWRQGNSKEYKVSTLRSY